MGGSIGRSPGGEAGQVLSRRIASGEIARPTVRTSSPSLETAGMLGARPDAVTVMTRFPGVRFPEESLSR